MAKPPSHWLPGAITLEVKWLEHEADHLILSPTTLLSMYIYLSFPHILRSRKLRLAAVRDPPR
jgi:hypothetical protein